MMITVDGLALRTHWMVGVRWDSFFMLVGADDGLGRLSAAAGRATSVGRAFHARSQADRQSKMTSEGGILNDCLGRSGSTPPAWVKGPASGMVSSAGR